MKPKCFPGIFLFLLMISCATSAPPIEDDIIRQPENTPEQFVTTSGKLPEKGTCESPLVDSRDGTEIRLKRSEGGVGDYEVPAGKYGISEGELLRVFCSTGKVAGVVKE